MSPDELKMIKKYEGAAAKPVAVEEVADEEMYRPVVRKKLNPSSLISPASTAAIEKHKTKMQSGRKYNNYSTINNYNTAPLKKVINTKSPPKRSIQ